MSHANLQPVVKHGARALAPPAPALSALQAAGAPSGLAPLGCADTGRRLALQALAAGSKSFALCAWLFPRQVRLDAAVVYAFCRRADDLIDLADGRDMSAAVRGLRQEVAAIYAGATPAEPVLAAFQEVVQRRRIPRHYPDSLVDGFATDARPGPLAFQTLDELWTYGYQVAGTVGLMMCHVMGVTSERSLRDAAALGMAMQLTNIARDVAEDWDRGRRYVPGALLPARGAMAPVGPLDPAAAAALGAALPRLLALGEPLYRAGDRGLAGLSIRCAIAVRAARLVYSAIGHRLAERGFPITGARTVVPFWRKLGLLGRAVLGVLTVRLLAGARRARDRLRGHPPAPRRPQLLIPTSLVRSHHDVSGR